MIPFQSLFTVRTYHCYSSYLNKEKKKNVTINSCNRQTIPFNLPIYFISHTNRQFSLRCPQKRMCRRSSPMEYREARGSIRDAFSLSRPHRCSRHVRWFLGLRKLSRFSIWIFTLSRARLALRWWWFPPVFWVGFLRSDFSLFWFNFTVAGLTVADESLA